METDEIPKIIHMTWKDLNVPASLRRCVDSFSNWNPGWEIKFWTDDMCDDFVRMNYPDAERVYFGFRHGILRADFFRILVLHYYGGIYSDIDIECLRPLDDLLADYPLRPGHQVLLPSDHPLHEQMHFGWSQMYMNDFMAALPGASLLQRLIEVLAEFEAPESVHAHEAVMFTGPEMLSSVIESYASPEHCGLTLLPWRKIHPIPDVSIFAHSGMSQSQVRFWQLAIEGGGWKVAWRPYVVHYWHHSYLDGTSTLDVVGERLFDGNYRKLVEWRFESKNRLIGTNDENSRSLRLAAEIALDFVGRRERWISIVRFDESKMADAAPPDCLRNFLELCEGTRFEVFNHLYFSESILGSNRTKNLVCSTEDAIVQKFCHYQVVFVDASGSQHLRFEVLASNLRNFADFLSVRPGGYLIVEGLGSIGESADHCEFENQIVQAGFDFYGGNIGEPLCFRRRSCPSEVVPDTVHMLDSLLPSHFIENFEKSLPTGWRLKVYGFEEMLAILRCNGFEAGHLSLRDRENLKTLVSVVLMETVGGIIVRPTGSCDLARLVAEVSMRPLSISARMDGGLMVQDPSQCGYSFMSSTRGHRFWFNVANEIFSELRSGDSRFCFGKFLFERTRLAESFLLREERPIFVSDLEFGFDLSGGEGARADLAYIVPDLHVI